MQTRLFVIVGLGAALGSVARYLVSVWIYDFFGTGYGWGTLTVNVLGSFLIGLYATLTEPDGRLPASTGMRHFVIPGFCGGFTTFSVFSLETLLIVESGQLALAATHVAVSVILWLLAVWVGYRVGAAANQARPTF